MDRHDDAPRALDDLRDLRLVQWSGASPDVRERRAVILSGQTPRFARRAAWTSAILHLAAAGLVAIALHRSNEVIAIPADFHITLQGRVASPAPPSPSPPAPTPPAQAPRVTQPVVEKPDTKGAIVPKPDRSHAAERAPVRPPTPGRDALSAPASGSRSALSANEVRVGPGGGIAGDFPFAYYLNGVRAAIQRNWSPPRGAAAGGALDATVRFAIARDGSVSDVIVEERSGVSSFDEAAATSVRRAAPFAPLPRAYGHDDLVVHFGFHYDE